MASESPTDSLPRALTAAPTARSGPTTIEVAARSSATSARRSWSLAASSLNPKSMIHTSPSEPRKMLARRRSRWAMRSRRRMATCCQIWSRRPSSYSAIESIEVPSMAS